MPRVLLLLPTTTYRTPDFLEAAARLGVEVTVASEEPSTLERLNPDGLLTLNLRDPDAAARRALAFAASHPIDAVVGVDEDATVAAAAIAASLGLRHNPVEAVRAARNKAVMRRRLEEAGVPAPRHRLHSLDEDPTDAARAASYPCVLKPTFLAASRGVIRANDEAEFLGAWRRIAAILADPDVARRGGEAAREILVEEFLPGDEVAVEGLLEAGRLLVLALFDKPDPLNGPYFEETIYVTPSRLAQRTQSRIASVASAAATALGLVDGPIHAELRVRGEEAWILEIAARSIGGLCSRTLRFGTGLSLEELILRHALGRTVDGLARESRAAGVMMIPIPHAGVLEGVEGLDDARAVPEISDLTISAHPGQTLVPLPEGSHYLGFLFARAKTPAEVEAALREAHGRLLFRIG
ncbi:MAG TPA: ATP-grasp domain-containing protein [Thermoanaerobaculia bacterium]|jgi:formate-dependent phosphoribosylglycinamide formyltransferase (GAR transformylase)